MRILDSFIYFGGAEAAWAEKSGERRKKKKKKVTSLFIFSRLYRINTPFLFKTVKENKIKRDNGMAVEGLGLPPFISPERLNQNSSS